MSILRVARFGDSADVTVRLYKDRVSTGISLWIKYITSGMIY